MAAHAEHIGGEHEEFEFVGFRLSWGAVFAGLVVAVVVQVLLSLLGLAIGLGAVNFQTGQPFAGIGVGAGIWAVATALISLFVGGLAAGHMAGIVSRFDGIMHGVLVWGLSVILALWALSTGISTLLGGMFGVAGQTLAAAITGATGLGAAAVTQVQPGAVAAADTSAQGQIVAILEQQGMTRSQARDVAGQIQQTTESIQLQAERIRARAPAVATQVAGTVSTATWWILLAAILSLVAAAFGAALTAEH
ncbi:MAG TPA: hypothetical protein VF188_09280 [Longimicrobiales bacterium]